MIEQVTPLSLSLTGALFGLSGNFSSRVGMCTAGGGLEVLENPDLCLL